MLIFVVSIRLKVFLFLLLNGLAVMVFENAESFKVFYSGISSQFGVKKLNKISTKNSKFFLSSNPKITER